MRRELLVVVALGLLAVAVGVTWPFGDAGPRVVGARRPLPPGTRVRLEDLTSVERPAGLPLEQAFRLERVTSVLGTTVVRDVEAGAPITRQDVGHSSTPRQNAGRQRRASTQLPGNRVRGAARLGRMPTRRPRSAG
ncbi:MAG: hypothetical protein IAE78_24745 [Myxococcus sp.]|nr:hypothetical protein [Myxococcus sp.]